jgi:formylglycine-generating enzyme required for sulfatase activity
MDKNQALQNLLNETASEEEIGLLKQALASGEISIGRDVNRSVVIIGSGNKVELTAEALGILKPETTSDEPVEGEPPYMGMRYFDTSNAGLFYGREALTRELAARVANEPFLAIVGASGSGKSSVARAGLIPALQMGAVHVIAPTAHPLESLATSLTRDSESVTVTATLMDDLQNDSRSLRLFIRKILASSGKPNLLLLVDQFEETFTLCKDAAERSAFIENLLAAADEDDGRVCIVLTLRADFYHHCAEYEGLRLALEKHQAYIGAMTSDELREAITAPAQKNGWDFQPGLVDLILRDVGTEPGALPLLSHALLETWKRRQGRTLTLAGYADAGGVKKAIAQTAESVYDHLTPAEQTIARGIFLRLTELGEGTQDTRRRVKLDELGQAKAGDAVIKVLKTLTDARLVTAEQDSAEVAHEALIREWGTLRKWLDEDRESLRLQHHLTESAQEWERRGREAGELYRGARLKQLQDWLKEHGDALSPLEGEFVKASQNSKKQERTRQFIWAGVGFVSSLVVEITVIIALVLSNISAGGFLDRFVYYKPVDMEGYWVTIPAGEFQMGSENGEDKEKPVHTVYVDEFQIGKYEVTNRQYYQCVKAGVCVGNAYDDSKAYHPVVSVNWHDAVNYCEWAGGRLPTEAEWEKAARGPSAGSGDGRSYPWGENIDCTYANYAREKGDYCVGDTTPVGSYESGKSPYGVYDMAGNVWEWTSSLYAGYPYNPNDGREDMYLSGTRMLRGGSWDNIEFFARSAYRNYYDQSFIEIVTGFRCARDVQ